MAEEYNRGLFHPWVPGIGQLGFIVLLLAVVLLINPIYAGNITQMSSSMGIFTEYYMWGNYATIIGMSLVLPFIMRVKFRFRSKELMITALVAMAIMSMIIATTTIGEIAVVACLIFGMAKMMGMIEVILPIRSILSPDGSPIRFYSVLYPITIGSTQFGTFFTSDLSLSVGWQAIHFYAAGILLLAAMLCLIIMHNKRFAKKMPFYRIDWPGFLCYLTAVMGMAYIFAFGKQQDWFNSRYIQGAVVLIVASIIGLLHRQLTGRHPFLMFRLYKRKQVRTGILLLVAQGMFMGVSSLMPIYTQAILGYNWVTNVSLSLMTLPGIVAAGFVAYHWIKRFPIKMYIFSGFASYMLYVVMLYFMMVPELNISQLYLPQLLNGYGMAALFISIWIYTFDGVPMNEMLPSVTPIMVFRSFIMMALFTALYGWAQYRFQWQSIGDQAVYFDTLQMSYDATLGHFGTVQYNAILAANKKLFGYTLIAGLGILTYIQGKRI